MCDSDAPNGILLESPLTNGRPVVSNRSLINKRWQSMEEARPPGVIRGEETRRDKSMDRVYIMDHMFDQLNVLYVCPSVCVCVQQLPVMDFFCIYISIQSWMHPMWKSCSYWTHDDPCFFCESLIWAAFLAVSLANSSFLLTILTLWKAKHTQVQQFGGQPKTRKTHQWSHRGNTQRRHGTIPRSVPF